MALLKSSKYVFVKIVVNGKKEIENSYHFSNLFIITTDYATNIHTLKANMINI